MLTSSSSEENGANCEETDSDPVIVEKNPLTTNSMTLEEEDIVDSPDDEVDFLTIFIMK